EKSNHRASFLRRPYVRGGRLRTRYFHHHTGPGAAARKSLAPAPHAAALITSPGRSPRPARATAARTRRAQDRRLDAAIGATPAHRTGALAPCRSRLRRPAPRPAGSAL